METSRQLAHSLLLKMAYIFRPRPPQRRHEPEPEPKWAPPPGLRYAPVEVAHALYRGILGRAPDPTGLRNLTDQLEGGAAIDAVVSALVSSSEFNQTMLKQLVPPHQLPDLVQLYPERYEHETTSYGVPMILYKADAAADFDFMEQAIAQYRYYDGTSGSWHSRTSDWVPCGTSSQARCGLRLCEKRTRWRGSMTANAHSGGMAPPSIKLSLQIFIAPPFLP